jgi:hypothetical protein
MSCTTAIEARIMNGASFETWKTATTGDTNTLATEASALTPNQLITLQTLENDIFATVNCIREKSTVIRAAPTSVSNIQERIVALQKELSMKEDQYEVAKQRAESIYATEQKTSNYEGWFPLGRSMRPTSLFILIGFSIFFTLFFFGMLMSLLGFNIQLSWVVPNFQMPGARPALPSQGWIAMIRGWINPLSLAAGTALLVTGGFLISMRTK